MNPRYDGLALRGEGMDLRRDLRLIEPNARDSGHVPDGLAPPTAPFRRADDNDQLGAGAVVALRRVQRGANAFALAKVAQSRRPNRGAVAPLACKRRGRRQESHKGEGLRGPRASVQRRGDWLQFVSGGAAASRKRDVGLADDFENGVGEAIGTGASPEARVGTVCRFR